MHTVVRHRPPCLLIHSLPLRPHLPRSGAPLRVRDTSFSNTALDLLVVINSVTKFSTSGGAVFLASATQALFDRVTFRGFWSARSGGIFFADAASMLVVRNSWISGGAAQLAGGAGGALCCYAAP